MDSEPLTLFTPRLTLRPLRAGDAVALFQYRSHEQVARFQGWVPESVDDAAEFLAKQLQVGWLQPDSWFQLGIEGREGSALIGDLGVHTPEDPRQVELGVSLAPAAQGKGLATEALRGLIDHLFGSEAIHRIFASVDPDNTAACALLARLGMRCEAHFRQSYWTGDRWVDDVVFAVLRGEWQSRPGIDLG